MYLNNNLEYEWVSEMIQEDKHFASNAEQQITARWEQQLFRRSINKCRCEVACNSLEGEFYLIVNNFDVRRKSTRRRLKHDLILITLFIWIVFQMFFAAGHVFNMLRTSPPLVIFYIYTLESVRLTRCLLQLTSSRQVISGELVLSLLTIQYLKQRYYFGYIFGIYLKDGWNGSPKNCKFLFLSRILNGSQVEQTFDKKHHHRLNHHYHRHHHHCYLIDINTDAPRINDKKHLLLLQRV